MNRKINIPEYEVSEFNKVFKDVIQDNFDYIRIKGEISELKTATKGQIYLTLKDKVSILSGVIWEQKIKYLQLLPEVGMEVVVSGKITTWSKFKTTYQIDIDKIELAGEGALLKLIEDRKKKLNQKGYFDEENKKQIPFLPNKIGVITSPTGSVIHDIINRIFDRFKVPIEIWPVSVQGVEAVESIIEAITGFNNMNLDEKPDVVIIARGGGSTEDLMAFNDEKLAISVYNSSIPIISAVGHETDTTIIDYVSDLRASTPTAAAEKVVPVRSELLIKISSFEKGLEININNNISSIKNNFTNITKLLKVPNSILKNFKEKLSYISQNLNKSFEEKNKNIKQNLKHLSKILKEPDSLIILKKTMILNLTNNLDKIILNNFYFQKKDLQKSIRLLNANSITTNLKKGYSILTKKNKIVKCAKLLKPKDNLKAQLLDDTLTIEVKKIN